MIQISEDTWSPDYSTEKVRVKEGAGVEGMKRRIHVSIKTRRGEGTLTDRLAGSQAVLDVTLEDHPVGLGEPEVQCNVVLFQNLKFNTVFFLFCCAIAQCTRE